MSKTVRGSRRTLVLGDFNARLNRDRLVKGGFGGPFVPDTETAANGERLLEFVSRHNLMVANSLFPAKKGLARTYSWRHPRGNLALLDLSLIHI